MSRKCAPGEDKKGEAKKGTKAVASDGPEQPQSTGEEPKSGEAGSPDAAEEPGEPEKVTGPGEVKTP